MCRDGDYGSTVDISTRAGYDSDCNPANAAGILGTMLGYSNIPDYWKQGLDRVEHRNFVYTDISLLDVYSIGYGLKPVFHLRLLVIDIFDRHIDSKHNIA